jgi:hypothetical protein
MEVCGMRKWFFWALLTVVVMVVFAIRLLPDMLNKPPVIKIPDMIIDEGKVLTIDLDEYTSDEKMSALVYTKTMGPGEIKGNIYSFSPNYQQSGKYTVSISVVDQHNLTGETTFNLEVREVNRVPTFSIPDRPVSPGETISINLDDFSDDPDLDPLKYSLESGGGQIIGSSYTYRPLVVDGYRENVRISVSDGRGGKTIASFDIFKEQIATTIDSTTPAGTPVDTSSVVSTATDTTERVVVTVTTPQNSPPVANIPDQRISAGGTLLIDLASFITDRDNDPLTLRIASGPGRLERTMYTYASTNQDSGRKVVEIEISDGKTTVRSSFAVIIETPNRPPVVSNIPSRSLTPGQQLRINLSEYFSDPDGDSLSYLIVSGPGSIENNQYTFQTNSTGRFSAVVRASDGRGGAAEGTVVVTVEPSNQPPTISLPARRIAEGEVLTVDLSNFASDPDGDRLSFSIVSGPGSIQGSIYTFRTDFNSAGMHSIVIRASDGKGGTADGTLRVEVVEVNRPPTISIPGVTVAEGERYVMDLSQFASDPDGDPLVYTLVRGIGRIQANEYILEPGYDDYGFYTVEISVSDSKGGLSSSTFNVLVTDTNRPPEFVVPDQVTIMNRTIRLDLRDFSKDPDGDYLRYELVYGPGFLTGSIYSFIPEELGSKTVMLKASDLKGGEATTTFTITVR